MPTWPLRGPRGLRDLPPDPSTAPERRYPSDAVQPTPSFIPTGGTRFIALADRTISGTKTLLRGTDNQRVSLVLTNNDGATNIRVGDSNVSATQGVRVSAGASLRFTSKSELWAVSEGGAVTISMSEELL